MVAEGKWALHVLLLGKQLLFECPQEPGSQCPKVLCETAEFEWDIEPLQAAVDAGRRKRREAGCQELNLAQFNGSRVQGLLVQVGAWTSMWNIGLLAGLIQVFCNNPCLYPSICSGRPTAGWLGAELAMSLVSPGAQPVLYSVAGAGFLHAFSLASPFRSQASSFLFHLGNGKLEESYLIQAGGAGHVSN